MISHAIKLGLGALVVLALANLPARAAEEEKPAGKAPDHAAMEKMMEEFAAPVQQHEDFKKFVGRWKADVKSYCQGPDKPQTYAGSANYKLLMGGRYLVETFISDMNGKPFEGFGINAYDKAQKKYTGVWIDNMSTGILVSEGQCDEATGTLTQTGESDSPMGKVKFRMVTSPVKDDSFTFTMYMTTAGAPEAKAMEITYTRQK